MYAHTSTQFPHKQPAIFPMYLGSVMCRLALVMYSYVCIYTYTQHCTHTYEQEASDLLHNVSLRNGTSDRFPKGTKIKEVVDEDLDGSLTNPVEVGNIHTHNHTYIHVERNASRHTWTCLQAFRLYLKCIHMKHAWRKELPWLIYIHKCMDAYTHINGIHGM